MTPTDICVSLETAQALKEAGWEKETVFSYYIALDGEDPFLRQTVNSILEYFPAPTLGELLEEVISHYGEHHPKEFTLQKIGEGTRCMALYCDPDNYIHIMEVADTPVEALANLWINHPEIRKS